MRSKHLKSQCLLYWKYSKLLCIRTLIKLSYHTSSVEAVHSQVIFFYHNKLEMQDGGLSTCEMSRKKLSKINLIVSVTSNTFFVVVEIINNYGMRFLCFSGIIKINLRGRPWFFQATQKVNLTVVLEKITTNSLSHAYGTQLDISLGNNALRAQPAVVVIGFWRSPYIKLSANR